MRRNHLLLVLLVVALVATGCSSSRLIQEAGNGTPIGDNSGKSEGTPAPRHGTVFGTVVDDAYGSKLWSGTVEIAGKKGAIKDGSFQIANIPYGTYAMKVSKQYYVDRTVQVAVNKSSVIVDIQMTPAMSSSELDLFARIVHSEAKGESYRGQVAVASSILNRTKSAQYPNTINGIVNQVVVANGRRYYQYEPVLNGSIRNPAGNNAKMAVRDALAGWDPTNGATGFFAPAKVGRGSWVWSRPATTTIGNHRFFR